MGFAKYDLATRGCSPSLTIRVRRAFGAPARLGRVSAPATRQQGAARRAAIVFRFGVPVTRKQAKSVPVLQSVSCSITFHRGAWRALVPFAGAHAILNYISEKVGVLPGALRVSQIVPESASKSAPRSDPKSAPESAPDSDPQSGPKSVPESAPKSAPKSDPESAP